MLVNLPIGNITREIATGLQKIRENTFNTVRGYRSKKMFVEVLAHEMVHHYQALHNEPVGHGPSFYRWRDKLNKKGLQHVRVYKE